MHTFNPDFTESCHAVVPRANRIHGTAALRSFLPRTDYEHCNRNAHLDFTENRAQTKIGVTESYEVPRFWDRTTNLRDLVFLNVVLSDFEVQRRGALTPLVVNSHQGYG